MYIIKHTLRYPCTYNEYGTHFELHEINVSVYIHADATIKPNMFNQVKQADPLHLQIKQISNTTFSTISDK